jgi:hypothetical protein
MRDKAADVLKSDRRTFLKQVGSGAVMWSGLPFVEAKIGRASSGQRQTGREKTALVSPLKTYRMMEWECHTPPEGKFNINVEAAVRAARDAGAESLMFYTQDHWVSRTASESRL